MSSPLDRAAVPEASVPLAYVDPLPDVPDDRIYCDPCRHLALTGCTARDRASVMVNRAPTEDVPARYPPHRCTGFVPRPDAADKRSAITRWPYLFQADELPVDDGIRRRVRPAVASPTMPAQPARVPDLLG